MPCRSISKNSHMRDGVLFKWIGLGVIQGIIVFFSIYATCPSTVSIQPNGQVGFFISILTC